MIHETEITIGNIELTIAVDFRVSPLIPATYWDPAEGGEIELEEVWVTGASGATYDLSRDELMDRGWDTWLDNSAWRYAEDCLIDELYYAYEDGGDWYNED